MKLTKEFGIIENIESSKLLFNGSCYFIDEAKNNKTNINILKSNVSNFSFENKINEIITDFIKNENDISDKIKNDEIQSFFESKSDRIIDVIIMTETGIVGKEKVDLENSSILYLSIFGNIKLGFFINKYLAKIILLGGENNDTDKKL